MRIGLALLVFLLVLPAPSLAQVPDSPASRTYGTPKTFVALTPWNFVPIDSTVTYQTNFTPNGLTISRTNALGPQTFLAPVNLPEGAVVTEMQAVFCDTSATNGFMSLFVTQPRMAGSIGNFGPNSTGVETPGCVDRTIVFGTPNTIDNNNNTYYVQIDLGAAGTSIQFSSLRVGYHLQVSAPGGQTFNDVPPSHPFFQFIQALAAAGITGGCNASPPLYCPDDLVTRGQMAVLLSRALGLHFSP